MRSNEIKEKKKYFSNEEVRRRNEFFSTQITSRVKLVVDSSLFNIRKTKKYIHDRFDLEKKE